MQTQRRFSFRPRGTNTRTYTCARGPNNASSIDKRRETLYLPTAFDPSPLAFSLVSHSLTHPSSPPLLGWMWLCFRSLLQGYTHPSVCRCVHCLSGRVWVCVWRCTLGVCVCSYQCVATHVGDWGRWILNSGLWLVYKMHSAWLLWLRKAENEAVIPHHTSSTVHKGL